MGKQQIRLCPLPPALACPRPPSPMHVRDRRRKHEGKHESTKLLLMSVVFSRSVCETSMRAHPCQVVLRLFIRVRSFVWFVIHPASSIHYYTVLCLPRIIHPYPTNIKVSNDIPTALSRGRRRCSLFRPFVRRPSLSAFDVSWECKREAAEYKARQPTDRPRPTAAARRDRI